LPCRSNVTWLSFWFFTPNRRKSCPVRILFFPLSFSLRDCGLRAANPPPIRVASRRKEILLLQRVKNGLGMAMGNEAEIKA